MPTAWGDELATRVNDELDVAAKMLAECAGHQTGALLVVLDESVLVIIAKNSAAGKPLVALRLERNWLDEHVRDHLERESAKDNGGHWARMLVPQSASFLGGYPLASTRAAALRRDLGLLLADDAALAVHSNVFRSPPDAGKVIDALVAGCRKPDGLVVPCILIKGETDSMAGHPRPKVWNVSAIQQQLASKKKGKVSVAERDEYYASEASGTVGALVNHVVEQMLDLPLEQQFYIPPKGTLKRHPRISLEQAKTREERIESNECASCDRVPTINEDQLVLCAGCESFWYCDAKCQKDHWRRHKRDCKQICARNAALKAAKEGGPETPPLRFAIDACVECNLGGDDESTFSWASGRVVAHNYIEDGWRNPAPYQVKLDTEDNHCQCDLVYSKVDNDTCIRALPSE